MPNSSNLSESLGNDPNVVYPLENNHSNPNPSAHGNAPSTFLKKVLLEMLPIFQITEMLRTIMEMLPYATLNFTKKWKKGILLENGKKNTYSLAFSIFHFPRSGTHASYLLIFAHVSDLASNHFV